MRQFAALFLCVTTIGCLRPEWSAPLIATAPSTSSTNGEDDEELEPRVYEITEGDDYTLALESTSSRTLSVTFYATSEDMFYMPCEWQGHMCRGLLPTEARASRFLVLRDKSGECPRFRLFREDEELEIAEPFEYGHCGFVLGDPP